MRDCLTNRAGFDRVLVAVAATFLTVSATSVLAQSESDHRSAAELAIDAAIPRPEPANLPPPTINDFKLDTTASTPDAAAIGKTPETKPSDVATVPAAEDSKADKDKNDTATVAPETTAPATTAPAAPPATATPATEPVKEPTKPVSKVAAADQPVADKLREM